MKAVSCFPATPDFTGVLEPGRMEAEARDLEVEGSIPPDINGLFVRAQPDPQYPPMLGDDIFFNGDGAISAFRFENGHVDFIHRYVQTERLQAQRLARRGLTGLYRNPHTDDPSLSLKSRSTANTNVIGYGGQLLALKEDSLPYALSESNLETLGIETLSGQITSSTFTAHPKVDPATGNLCAFAYEARGDGSNDVAYFEFDAQGKKLSEIWIKSPFVGMIHDIAITANYAILPLMPLKVDLERIRKGGRHFEWDSHQDALFGVFRRHGNGSDARWMSLPPAFQGHVLNAFEDGGLIHCDVALADGNVFPFFPDSSGYTTPLERIRAPLCRVSFDLSSPRDRASSEVLIPATLEFGKVDDRYMGRVYRHAFMIGQDFSQPYDIGNAGPPHPFFFNMLAHVDVVDRTLATWWPGPQHSLQEPVFIPRRPGCAEGDGYCFVVVNHIVERRSELILLDTADLSDGPIARVRCPMRLRMGLHGNWLDRR